MWIRRGSLQQLVIRDETIMFFYGETGPVPCTLGLGSIT
jgi:hypothetical protein